MLHTYSFYGKLGYTRSCPQYAQGTDPKHTVSASPCCRLLVNTARSSSWHNLYQSMAMLPAVPMAQFLGGNERWLTLLSEGECHAARKPQCRPSNLDGRFSLPHELKASIEGSMEQRNPSIL